MLWEQGGVGEREGSLPETSSPVFINWLFAYFSFWLVSVLVTHPSLLALVPERAQLQLLSPCIDSP